MNGYDFDKTIYAKDSSVEFYFYLINKYPKYVFHMISTSFIYMGYLCKIVKKKRAKEKMFSIFSKISNLDDEVHDFWKNKQLQEWYLKVKQDDDVIISASPYFLIKEICDKYNIKNIIATEVDKKTGLIVGNNCYGEEKANRFKESFKQKTLKNFFSDSYSDVVMLQVSENFTIIKDQKVLKVISGCELENRKENI